MCLVQTGYSMSPTSLAIQHSPFYNNSRWLYTDSPSVSRGLQDFSTWDSWKLKFNYFQWRNPLIPERNEGESVSPKNKTIKNKTP